MNRMLRSSLIRKFFSHEEFRLFANAIPQALLILNEVGEVVLANKAVQSICFKKTTDLTPFAPYHELIDAKHREIFSLITDTCTYHINGSRQIVIGEQTFLLEANVIMDENGYRGCTISLSDITEVTRREKQHELLYQISSALSVSGANNLTTILAHTANQILKSMQISSINIMLLNRVRNHLEVLVDTEPKIPNVTPRTLKMGEGIAGKCAKEMRPYAESDIQNSPHFTQKRKDDKGGLLVVPIVSQGKLLGVINACSDKPRYFTENEVQFLTIVANEIGVAIQNAHLYDKLNHKIELLMKLFSVSVLVGSRNVETRIQQIINLVPQLLEAQGCYVYLYMPSQEKFVLKYRSAADLSIPVEIEAKSSRILRSIIEDNKTLIINDIKDYSNERSLKKIGVYNFLSTPLVVGDKPFGVVSVFNKIGGNFTKEDRDLLSITQMRIATKLENLQLVRNLGSEKELLDKTINNISEGVAVLNRRRKIIVWNEYMAELTGIRPEEAIGQPCYRVLYNRLNLKRITQEIYLPSDQRQPGTYYTEEEEMHTLDGNRVWMNVVVSPIQNQNGHIENTVLVFRNVTEQREFLRAKNEFVSLATHELRTPITAIKGYLSMLMNNAAGKLNVQQKKYVTKAYVSTERLVGLVEELLDVVRIDEKRVPVTIQPCILNRIIEDTIEELTQKAHSKGIKIQYRSGPSVDVLADPIKTKQILENLIDNAIKYTKSNGSISLSLERINNNIVVAVRDNGVGIPKKHLNDVFERFVRVDNPLSVKAGGTGLGLYIVKNLVEQQNGKIWVNSQVGKGTTFYFSLPLVPTSPLPQTKNQTKSQTTREESA